MNFVAFIRILFVFIVVASTTGHHDNTLLRHTATFYNSDNQPITNGDVASHSLIDVPHCDDIFHEIPRLEFQPDFYLVDEITFLIPDRTLSGPPPCWQPPEIVS
jgi:hypothetical protein